ncbi:TetR-like C-terminal domain-containing protein [Microtetraspora fusca]|uniref:TetR/AcrR family transcriptional regulator C-terminal ligand-binding domain-containing protein n=1 Tax=Microtetraspora fusca TaxID=1997 RepID=A0ABW6VIA4_MICFU|nr:TetR-like C-terminal domain-containing protein [Microtetraspora fusca]
MTTSVEGRARGMRGARLRAAVLEATIARIESVGIEDTRIADIAQMAGIHETSIYRRWKTRPRLLVDALLTHTERSVPVPDTGSVRQDLIDFFTDLAAFVSTPTGAAFVRGTVVSETDPEVEAARREFWTERISKAGVILDRGRSRGEVADGTDPELVLFTLGGLLHIYVTHIGAPLPEATVVNAVDLVLDGMKAGAPSAG